MRQARAAKTVSSMSWSTCWIRLRNSRNRCQWTAVEQPVLWSRDLYCTSQRSVSQIHGCILLQRLVRKCSLFKRTRLQRNQLVEYQPRSRLRIEQIRQGSLMQASRFRRLKKTIQVERHIACLQWSMAKRAKVTSSLTICCVAKEHHLVDILKLRKAAIE